MSRLLRQFAFAILRFSTIPFFLREIVQRNKVTIVVLHAPSPECATAHLQALRSRYNIIPLTDYLHARTNGDARGLPPKSLIITIDDGHASNFSLKPLLEELRVPITIFLCSGIVGTHRHYWWFHTRSDREATTCKAMADADRLKFLMSRNYSPTQEYSDRQALSQSEIEELKPWVDFQAHTVTHPILPACSNERAEQEIGESKADLELRYGLKIRALAFPNGDYSEREIQLARSAGYECALTLDRGANDRHTDLFRLKRTPLPDDASVNEMLVKASGFWEFFWRRGLTRTFARHDQ